MFIAACGGGGGSGAASTWTVGASSSTPTVVVANKAPTAAIQVSPASQVPTRLNVAFDGRGSTDGDSDALVYRWTLSARPAGSAAALSATSGSQVDLVPDVPGEYKATLVVNDGKVDSAAVTSTVVAVNSAPQAVAGGNFSVRVGEMATLDGTGSSDANGDALTYTWTLVNKPVGSAAALTGGTDPRPTFVPDVLGEYDFTLTVNDGLAVSNTASVRVTATDAAANRAPQANAGPDQNVTAGATVTLDAGASLDPDAEQLSYAWSMKQKPAGSTAALGAPTALRPTFVADVSGTYVVELVVSDGTLTSSADAVAIVASAGNSAPVANAGPDQNVLVGTEVQLAGENSSDADSDLLEYTWSIVSRPTGSTAQLVTTGSDDPGPTFTPDVAGTYVVGLIVSDGKSSSAQDLVTIIATVGNAVPVANAGMDQSVAVGKLVTLDGSQSSDANGDALTYSWTWVSRPAGSLAALVGATAATASFTPDVAGDYVASLAVSDGQRTSVPDAVTVSVYDANVNIAPIAIAGTRQRVTLGPVVQLDGTRSYDPNGTALTYRWRFKSKPRRSTVTLSGATTATPTFLPDVAGNYVVELVVSDGVLSSLASSVAIQVRRR